MTVLQDTHTTESVPRHNSQSSKGKVKVQGGAEIKEGFGAEVTLGPGVKE